MMAETPKHIAELLASFPSIVAAEHAQRDAFVVKVDTREQRPLDFGPGVTVERATLREGDYTARGLEGIAAIERKSVADLIGSLTQGRNRFTRELERLRSYEFAAVVVEGSLADIVEGNYRSKAHPSAMVGSVCALIADYRLPVIFADDRATAATVVLKLLRRIHAARTAVAG